MESIVTLGLRPAGAGIMEMIPSLPIHSSFLIALIAGLFLAALMLRAQRLSAQTQTTSGLTPRRARIARRRAQRRVHRRAPRTERRAQMTTTAGDSPQPAAPRGTASTGITIHWGRTLLALVGLVSLLTATVTALLATFTTLTWAAPGISAAVFLLALVSLQVSAVLRRRRRRRARLEAAMREAMNPDVETLHRRYNATAQEQDRARQQAIFDALSADERGVGGPDSLVKLDEDGLPDNAERLFSAEDVQRRAAIFDQAGPVDMQWEPRDVPQPKYLAVEKAQRPEPAPEQATEQPKPKPETKLRQPAAPAASSAQDSEEPAEDSSAQEAMDLDAVLKRRRA